MELFNTSFFGLRASAVAQTASIGSAVVAGLTDDRDQHPDREADRTGMLRIYTV